MNYITTNIRIPEEDYLRLKSEAAKARKSFSEVIRRKIGVKSEKTYKVEVERFMARIRKHAAENAKYLKDLNGVKIIREMRDNAKW